MTATPLGDGPVLRAEGLRKTYGEQLAVADVSLEVQAGHILGVLGPNGAGKSTTLRMLTTMTRAGSSASPARTPRSTSSSAVARTSSSSASSPTCPEPRPAIDPPSCSSSSS